MLCVVVEVEVQRGRVIRLSDVGRGKISQRSLADDASAADADAEAPTSQAAQDGQPQSRV